MVTCLVLLVSALKHFWTKSFVKSSILLYLGPRSTKIQKRLKCVFPNVIPWGKINLTFKTHSRISHLFRFNDPIPTDLVSNIIYSYKCPSCNVRYIGETAIMTYGN